MAVLQTHHLTTGYPSPRKPPMVISKNLDLELNAGELVCLLGPNGAGKSTLMQTLAGMLKPLEGGVLLRGEDVHQMPPATLARHMSIVLTERPNVGMMTGRALVALGRHPYTDWSGQLTAHDQAIVEWALEAVNTEKFADKPVAEMSDGQRQKIMIARALAQEPDVMLLDEPTAFLDLPRRVEVMRLLKQLSRATDRAILLSTHDLDLALRTADRVWLMSPDGVIQVGAPEDLILNGAFATVFEGEGIEFDAATGSFKVAVEQKRPITLTGEGLGFIWTQRALEREGYEVVTGEAPIRVEVSALKDRWRWQVWQGAQVAQFHTLYDLLSELSTAASPAPF